VDNCLTIGTWPTTQFIQFCLCTTLLMQTKTTVFRTNSAYKRWDEARKAWGVIVNHSRTLLRQSASWIYQAPSMSVPEKRRHMKRIAHAVWLFPRAQQRHLLPPREDEEAYQYAVRQRLQLDDPILAQDMIEITRHRPSRALYEVSSAIQEINIEIFRRVAMEEACAQLCNAMGGTVLVQSSCVLETIVRSWLASLFSCLLSRVLHCAGTSTWWGLLRAAHLHCLSFFLVHSSITPFSAYTKQTQHMSINPSINQSVTEYIAPRCQQSTPIMLLAFWNFGCYLCPFVFGLHSPIRGITLPCK